MELRKSGDKYFCIVHCMVLSITLFNYSLPDVAHYYEMNSLLHDINYQSISHLFVSNRYVQVQNNLAVGLCHTSVVVML